jgi:hypothetical protein
LTLTNKTLVETLEAMEHKDVILPCVDYRPKMRRNMGSKVYGQHPYLFWKIQIGLKAMKKEMLL